MSEYITTALQEEAIKTAQEKLAELIRSDFARIDRMKADEEVTDFSKLDTITIGVMPGDGIGPLIMTCLLYTSPSPRDGLLSRMPSSA